MDGSLSILRDQAELARHVEFVRRLARGLVADRASAEDVSQEVWVAALERREALSGSVRAWLARVLRNQAALSLRREERRGGREAQRAVSSATVATDELVARLDLHRHLVAEVVALPEVYREVLLRRYFEDESPREIARRLAVPEATVRTRLARAHERLRRSVDRRLGGERALTVLGLVRLARDVAPAPGTLARLVPLLAMKKTLAVACLAVLALVAVWSVTRDRAHPRAVVPPVETSAGESARAELRAPPSSTSERLQPREEPAGAVASSGAPAATPPEEAAVPAAAPAKDDDTAWLEFHVRDADGWPIADADVRLTCYRTRDDPGSSHSTDEMPAATTDAAGVARLEYRRRLWGWAGPERPEIGGVCYTVEHAEYVGANGWSLSVDQSPAEVVLHRGARLVVAALGDDGRTLVTGFEPHLGDEVQVRASDWTPARDGRLSCSRVPPGRHALYLTREGEGGTWASAVVEFVLAAEETKELTLALQPPRTLAGMLDPVVPRPVVDGEVLLDLYVGDPADRRGPRGARLFGAKVRPDGTFELGGLPPGSGEMIGMCAGWVSRAPEGSGLERGIQPVDPAAPETLVLAMEPTARLEVVLLDPDREPVTGAQVALWPNVHWSIGYSNLFLERRWSAWSDASGRAVVEDLPPGDEALAVIHDRFCIPARVTDRGVHERRASASLLAGETSVLELVLEECGEER